MMGAVSGSPIGHMSPVTALTFLAFSLLCPVVFTAPAEGTVRLKAVWWCAIVIIAAYCMLLLAYLLGTPMFYGGRFIPPAATTSFAFVALGVALAALSLPLGWPGRFDSDQDDKHSFRTLAMLFIFLAAGIISAGYFYHRHHEKQYLGEVERQLSAIADLKMSELLLWREERLADAGIFHNNEAFAAMVKNYLRQPEGARSQREIITWFSHIKSNRNYSRFFLLDSRGEVRLSFPESASEPLSPHVKRQGVESLGSGKVTIADFYRNSHPGKIHLSILVPLFDPAVQGAPLAVLAMRIDPEKFLYPFLQRWPNPSSSAETLLVRRDGDDVIYLNDIRFEKEAALRLKIPMTRRELPAVKAVLGEEGIVRGIDYRGRRVVAALRSIPDSPWHLVSKMDETEIFAPLRERQWITMLLMSAMLLAAAAGVGFIWRQQRASHYRRFLLQTRQNEERLQCLLNVFQHEAMDVTALLDFALAEALRMTASSYGYIYYYDEEKQEFTLNSWSRDVMQSCSIMNPQTTYELEKTGLWGEAVRQRRPVMDNDFCAQDPLKKGCPEGHVSLTRFLTVPLIEQERIVAVVGVANKETDYEESDMLQLSLLMGSVWKIAERKLAEERVKQQVALTKSINRIFRDAMNCRTVEELGERCLAVAADATGSSFGFIGEIGPDGFLHDLAISNPGWDACTMIDQSGHRRPPGNFMVHGIYGRVLLDGKGFFTNDPPAHPDSVGLPQGHPPLFSFLGVPLSRKGQTYGMVALANRDGGYSQSELETLEALAPLIVEVFLRKRAELAVTERENRLKHAEELAHLGHWRYDLGTGRITWSDEMYRIFGLRRKSEKLSLALADITRHCHPDDMENCARSFDPAAQEDGGVFEYRIIRPGGEERHVVSVGEIERNEDDSIAALFGTVLDTTELRQKERELQQKNAEMERFAYTVSHDLKSPLVTVKSFVGFLEKDLATGDGERIAKDLLYMRTATDRMSLLLDQLLVMSRVGKVVTPSVRVQFTELMQQVLDLLAGSITERAVLVQVKSDEAVSLYGDRPRLVEIWQNLIENAVKYMGGQSAPRIEIGFEMKSGTPVFSVADNGMGIDPRYHAKIFSLFDKLDPLSEGTGLGLALVKRIVEMYEGKIWVESAGVGSGSCFRFTLPQATRVKSEE